MKQEIRHSRLRSIRAALVLAAAASVALWNAGCRTNGVESRTGRLDLIAYGADGERLDYEAFAEACMGGRAGAYEADVFLDPDTYAVKAWYPVSGASSLEGLSLPEGSSALAFNWPTARGFGFLVVDNGGKGFQAAPGTRVEVNLFHRAALDAFRRLDESLGKRADYVRSKAFDDAYGEAESRLETAAAPGASESLKGSEGLKALDAIARAHDLLLAEHGPVLASSSSDQVMIGLTIEGAGSDSAADRANVDRAASIAGGYGAVRFVFDASKDWSAYSDIVAYAKSKGLLVVGEPVDSVQDSELGAAACIARFKSFIDALPDVDVWEIGNEVNGGWTSAGIAERVRAAAEYAKSKGKRTLLTLFWQIGTATGETSNENNSQDCATDLFGWIEAKLPPSTRDLVDYATLSVYMEQAPLGLAFEPVMDRIAAAFPKSRVGLGELDYWCQEGEESDLWWYADESDVAAARELVLDQYYRASLAIGRSIGGCFWWYFADTSSDPDWTDGLSARIEALRDALDR